MSYKIVSVELYMFQLVVLSLTVISSKRPEQFYTIMQQLVNGIAVYLMVR